MKVTVAATQMACSWDIDENVAKAETMINEAADAGAQVILIQELFETPYFCIDNQHKHFDLAKPLEDQPTIKRIQFITHIPVVGVGIFSVQSYQQPTSYQTTIEPRNGPHGISSPSHTCPPCISHSRVYVC